MIAIENPASVSKKIEQRNLNDLKPHPLQHIYFPAEPGHDIQNFADTLKRGLDNPVEITPDNVIICGHRRVEAAKFLGWQTIDCWIRHDLAQKGLLAVEERFLEDNVERRQLGKLAAARCYQRLREIARGIRAGRRDRNATSRSDLRDQIGKSLGKSGRTLDRLLNVLRTPQEVQVAFEHGDLPLVVAERVSHLAPAVQEEIADEIQAGKSPSKVVEAHFKAETERQGGHLGNRHALLVKWNRFMAGLRRDVPTLADRLKDIPMPRPATTEAIDAAIAFLVRVKAAHHSSSAGAATACPDIVSGQSGSQGAKGPVIRPNNVMNGKTSVPDIVSGQADR